jgi:hypothetical protein
MILGMILVPSRVHFKAWHGEGTSSTYTRAPPTAHGTHHPLVHLGSHTAKGTLDLHTQTLSLGSTVSSGRWVEPSRGRGRRPTYRRRRGGGGTGEAGAARSGGSSQASSPRSAPSMAASGEGGGDASAAARRRWDLTSKAPENM